MIINHNIAALNTLNKLNAASTAQSKAMEKLSSGQRINSAADDAAGLAISEKMRSQIRGLDQATSNAQDASSLAQTAEGALNETTDILQRMRELATQAANDTNTTDDREQIQKEMNQLTSEVNRIGNTTEFNTQKLLDGSKSAATSASVTGKGAAATEITSGGTLTIAIDGASGFSVTVSGGESLSDIVDAINSGANSQLGTSGQTYASIDSYGELSINSLTTGSASSLTVTVSGGTLADDLNLSTDTTTSGSDGGTGLQFQIGANENQSLTLNISDMRSLALGISSTSAGDGFTNVQDVTNGTDSENVEYALDVSTADSAASAITTIDKAIKKVSTERANLGAYENRLDHTVNNLTTSSENLTSAESRIRDVDMAKEMSEQTKDSILAQAAQAMLSQANQQPQQVLQLLR